MALVSAQSQGVARWLIRRGLELIALLAIATVVAWAVARPPRPDSFYSHTLPPDRPVGTLLKSERFTNSIPVGGKGWRILYITTRGGTRVLASAVVVVPEHGSAGIPVIAWAHGTTGVVEGCAPSVLANPFDNVPDMDAIVRAGWAYVGTDYPGLGTGGGHAYLVGIDAARAVLDAVRAARQLTASGLGDRLVVWGHSQGGNSALWTGMRASEFSRTESARGCRARARERPQGARASIEE